LTFAALDCAAHRWAHALRACGIDRGAHVGLLAGNSPQWLAVAFGVWRAGGTLVPISTFASSRELNQTLTHADIQLLILQSRLGQRDLLALLERSSPPPSLRDTIVLDGEVLRPHQRSADFLQQAGLPPVAAAHPYRCDPDDIACILYTSGTTGSPKGVMLSHRAILSTIWPTVERGGLVGTDTLLSSLPLFWVAGLVIRALPTLASGAALVLMETFRADTALTLLHRYRPTALHLRPPQVGQLLAHPRFDPSLLARVHRGGGRVEWYMPALDAERTRLITGYGMTEMAGYVTALDWRDPPEVRRTQLGAPLPGVEMRIVDHEGRACGADDAGEIRVRGPGLFSGYYKQPAGSGLDDAGFLCTGDLGRIDGRGTLHFVGRSKDLLRIKGINVSPVEVETVLAGHPAVEAAYVVGLPADGLDQQLVALIVPRGPVRAETEAALQALAADALSHYKRPQRYLFIERSEVSVSATSKPQRAALAELALVRLAAVCAGEEVRR
jgi:acyl-CoA synthetase (AMP-forming)/AMP-acid ligase II